MFKVSFRDKDDNYGDDGDDDNDGDGGVYNQCDDKRTQVMVLFVVVMTIMVLCVVLCVVCCVLCVVVVMAMGMMTMIFSGSRESMRSLGLCFSATREMATEVGHAENIIILIVNIIILIIIIIIQN